MISLHLHCNTEDEVFTKPNYPQFPVRVSLHKILLARGEEQRVCEANSVSKEFHIQISDVHP